MTATKIRSIIQERYQQKWIARHIGSDYAHLNQVIKGRRTMTEELKNKLEQAIKDASTINPRSNNSSDIQ